MANKLYPKWKEAVAPTKAYYSLYCETDQKEILAETEIANPELTEEIEVTPAQNALCGQGNDIETRLITVRWTYSAGTKQGIAEHRYRLKNLSRIPGTP